MELQYFLFLLLSPMVQGRVVSNSCAPMALVRPSVPNLRPSVPNHNKELGEILLGLNYFSYFQVSNIGASARQNAAGSPPPGETMATAAQIAALNSTVASLQTTVDGNTATQLATSEALGVAIKEVDTFYILFAGCLVFLMQAGFATLEAGSVRDKNVRNVLLKNALDACVGALVWYLFGYGIASGGNAFIGTKAEYYALSGLDDTTSTYTANGYDWCAAPSGTCAFIHNTSRPFAQLHPPKCTLLAGSRS